MSAPTFLFRVVEVHGVRYLRVDDVASFIRELGGGEETDVRLRLDNAAEQLLLSQATRKEST